MKVLLLHNLNDGNAPKIHKLHAKNHFDLIFALSCSLAAEHSTAGHSVYHDLTPPLDLDPETAFSEVEASLPARGSVDILLLGSWPANVTLKSDLAAAKQISEPSSSSLFYSQLVLSLEPRYVVSLSDVYWEREPFRYAGGERITRFISLGSAAKKEKFMYAFTLKPAEEQDKGVSTTPCPFGKKRRGGDVPEGQGVFWDQGEIDRHKRQRVEDDAAPPPGYVCKICKEPGHYVHKCPENKRSLPDGYICRICGIPGHSIRDCPSGTSQGPSRRLKKRDTSKCWFCLSNPNVESHMILGIGEDCYTALAKGQLTDGHILIVPVAHYTSLRAIEARDDNLVLYKSITSEMDAIYSKVNQVQMEQGNYVVGFEVFGGGDPSNPQVRLSHMHFNLVPIDESLQDLAIEKFKAAAEEQGLVQADTLPASIAWPYIRLKFHGQAQDMIFTPPPPNGGPLVPFNLQFARGVLADLLGCPDRADWKRCVLDEGDEESGTAALRTVYPFLVE
ncbi:hypothetical protein HDU91_006049 [Kappamyces sp. JEL0680]|nr:hypothetical protein HDU91_006049 [Kappamyces sp. JEL0680]